jgi:hypothetical protein
MIPNRRIWHETYQCWWKRSRAERAVLNCAATWTQDGVSLRSLTVAEAIAARNEQARRREPLPFAEIHGLRFDPPASGISATRREGKLQWEAHNFALRAA